MPDTDLLRAIIVDDQPFAREDLRQMLRAHGELLVVGEAATVHEARQLLDIERPSVVFLDVQLKGETGFELLPFLPPHLGVVFVTAYDSYAVRAFEVNALDFLVKPVVTERLAVTVARLRSRTSEPPPLGSLEPDDRLFIQHDAGQRFVALRDILTVTVLGGNYSTVELTDGSRPVLRRTMAAWEESLPRPFSRVHRNAIANLAHAERLERGRDGRWELTLRGRAESLEVSRRRAPEVRSLMAAVATPL